MSKRVLVTGSSGLIGSEAVEHFHRREWSVTGVDNNMRADFFGPGGDTRWRLGRLRETCIGFDHRELDIRDRPAMLKLVAELRPDLIIHAARSRRTIWQRAGRSTTLMSTPLAP